MGYNFSNIEAKFNKINENNIDLIFQIKKVNRLKFLQSLLLGTKKLKVKDY